MVTGQAGDALLDAGPEGLDALPRATVNGTPLAYCERGTGEPVVLVHGSASDIRTWEGLIPAVATSHRVIAYSRRYARPNEDIPPEIDDRMETHVEDLVALLDGLDAAPAHLVGHSWGGFICLLTAIRRPDLVRSMVLEEPPVLSLFVSTPPRPGEVLPLVVRRPRTALAILGFGARAVAPAQRAFRSGDEERAMEKFGSGVLGRESYAEVPEERRRQMRENLGTLRAQLLGAGFPPLDEDEVRRVAAPALLLSGERSPDVLRWLTNHLRELLPAAERVEIPAASHRLHEENPEAVSRAVCAFLQARAIPSGSALVSGSAA